jgi:hypothetical protein
MVNWHSAVWDLLASGNTEEEIKESLASLDEDFIDEVKKDFDEENEEIKIE